MTNVEQYANQIPLLLRQTYKAFASDNRSAIAIALHNNGKKLGFNHLKRILDIDQRILTDELRRLISGAVVDHYTEYQNGERGNSYYVLTDYGINILTATLSVFVESYEPTIKVGFSSTTAADIINTSYSTNDLSGISSQGEVIA